MRHYYVEEKGWELPKRCPECRKLRRKQHRRSRKMYDAVCSKCGAQTQVPFKPVPGREVYCKECFKEVETSSAPQQSEESANTAE